MTPHATTSHINLKLMAVGDVDCTVRSTFHYEPSDPYAVRVLMDADGYVVEWIAARELLKEGLHRLAGIGDVCVHPGFDDNGIAVVHLELIGPDGEAVLIVPAPELEQFLDASFRSVPAGSETEHLDIDAVLAELLAGC